MCVVGVRSFRDLRAWQTSHTFKLAIYRLTESGSLAGDFKLRGQLREAAASATSQIAEGFGRFNPADFARFLGMAKASLMEAQNHLQDAVDRGHIGEDARSEHDQLAQRALRDLIALIKYLQSDTAARNAQRFRTRN